MDDLIDLNLSTDSNFMNPDVNIIEKNINLSKENLENHVKIDLSSICEATLSGTSAKSLDSKNFENLSMQDFKMDCKKTGFSETTTVSSPKDNWINEQNLANSTDIFNFCITSSPNLTNQHQSQNTTKNNSYSKSNTEMLIDFGNEYSNIEITGNSVHDSNKSTPKAEKNSLIKLGKSEVKNKLLKLSLSNALIQSPVNRRCSLEDGTSPESSIFNEAAKLAKQLSQMYSSSPKKNVEDSCDDLMEISPNWLDSESDISKDLELFKIPILEKMNEKNADNILINEKSNFNETNDCEQNLIVNNTTKKSIDIEALKERVNNHKLNVEYNKHSENIDSMISNLKDYVMRNDTPCTKKDEAQILLNSLSCLLKDQEMPNVAVTDLKKDTKELQDEKVAKNTKKKPKLIVRQGTFDIDLNNSKIKTEDSINSVDKNSEKDRLAHPEVNDIAEEIGKILSRNKNVDSLHTNLNGATSFNPTYIVVMRSPAKNVLNRTNTQNDEYLSTPIQNQKQFRRRSQSLTLPENKNIKTQNNGNKPNNMHSSKDCNLYKTPVRNSPLNRRNSISNLTPRPSQIKNLSAYHPTTGNSNSNIKASDSPRPSVLIAKTQKIQTNISETIRNARGLKHLQTDVNSKRFRLKSSENVTAKGPLKATHQIITNTSAAHVSSTPIKNCNIRRKSILHSPSFSINNINSAKKNSLLPIGSTLANNHSSKMSSPDTKFNRSHLSVTSSAKLNSNLLNVTGNNSSTTRRKSFSDTSRVYGKTTLGSGTPRNRINQSQEYPKLINKFKMQSTRDQPTLMNKENKTPQK